MIDGTPDTPAPSSSAAAPTKPEPSADPEPAGPPAEPAWVPRLRSAGAVLAGAAARTGPRLWAAGELSILLSLLMIEMWPLGDARTGMPMVLRGINVAAMAAVVGASLLRRWAIATGRADGARDERRDGRTFPPPPAPAGRSWWVAGAITAAMFGILLGGAALTGTLEGEPRLPLFGKGSIANWLGSKGLLVAVQQLWLQGFLLPVCRELLGGRTVPAVVLAAVTFGLVHAPNVLLIGLCTGAGLVWCGYHSAAGRLAPLVVSHLLLSTAVRFALPRDLTNQLEVGVRMLPIAEEYDFLRRAGAWDLYRRMSSEEFHRVEGGGTEAGFIDAVHRVGLGRPPTPEEAAMWLERRRHCLRSDVVRDVLTLPEFRDAVAGRATGAPGSR